MSDDRYYYIAHLVNAHRPSFGITTVNMSMSYCQKAGRAVVICAHKSVRLPRFWNGFVPETLEFYPGCEKDERIVVER